MTEQRHTYLIYFLNILAMAFWGISFVWIKIIYEFYHPFTVLVFRLFISAALLFILAIKFEKNAPKLEKKDLPLFMLLAFCEPFLYFVGESLGLLYVSSTVASLIVATIPVFMVFASFLFLSEKIRARGIVGILFSIAGIIALILDKNLEFKYHPRGVILMFLAVIAAIGFNIIGSKLVKKYKPITLIKYQNLFGAIYFIPLFLIWGKNDIFTVTPDFSIILNLVNLAVFSSSLSFLFYMMAVEKLGVNRANIFTYLIPLFTAFFAYILVKEPFDLSKIAGLILIVTGIAVSQTNRKFKFKFLFRRGS